MPLVATTVFLLTSSLARAQDVDFSNYRPPQVNAPVFDAKGVPLGPEYYAQLYVVKDPLAAPLGEPIPFLNDPRTGQGTGYFQSKQSVRAGDLPPYQLQVKVWQSQGGTVRSFEKAEEMNLARAVSKIVSVETGPRPNPPPKLLGLESFRVSASQNNPPVSSGYFAATWNDVPLVTTISRLLQPVSDPENDPVVFQSVAAASEQGGVIVRQGDRVTYLPNPDFLEGLDRFSYVVRDSAGDSATLWASISVTRVASALPANTVVEFSTAGGSVILGFTGTPGLIYELQRATAPSGPWSAVEQHRIPGSGIITFQDIDPPERMAFYRVILKPD